MAIAYRTLSEVLNANTANITLTIPASAVVDDIALAWVNKDTGGTAPTAPGGWTSLGSAAPTNGVWLYRHRIVGGDASSTHTWTFALDWCSGGILLYSGVHTTTSEDVTTTVNSATTGTAQVHTGLTTVTDNAMLVAIVGEPDAASTHTNPMGTERTDQTTHAVYDALQATAGASGNKTTTATVSNAWVAFLVALRPAAAAAAGPYPPWPVVQSALYRM